MFKRSSGTLGRVESPSTRKKQKTASGDEVQEEGRELLKAVDKLTERKTRRPIAAEFQRMPSKKLYPDYYKLIKKPIALDVIQDNLDDGEYVTLDLLREDLLQMCNNAKRYNEKGSMLYSDAAQIARLVKNWSNDAGNYSEDSDPEEASRGAAAKALRNVLNQNIKNILKDLKETKDRGGRRYIDIFLELPDAKLYPDYYTIIEEPVSVSTIEGRIKKNAYKSLDTFQEDMDQMWQNAFTYNDAKSYVAQDAKHLQKVVNKLIEEARLRVAAQEEEGKDNGNQTPRTKHGVENGQSTGSFKIKLGLRPSSATPVQTPVPKVKLHLGSRRLREAREASEAGRASPSAASPNPRGSITPAAPEKVNSPGVESGSPMHVKHSSPVPAVATSPAASTPGNGIALAGATQPQGAPQNGFFTSATSQGTAVGMPGVFETPIIYSNPGTPLIQFLSLCASQIQPPTILHIPAVPGQASLIYSWTLPITASSLTVSPSLCSTLLEGKRGYSLSLSLNGRKLTASRQANGQSMLKNSIWDLKLSSGMNCIECIVEAAESVQADGDEKRSTDTSNDARAALIGGKARERMVILTLLR